MQLEEKILDYIENKTSHPVSEDDIAQELALNNEDLTQLFTVLDNMEKEGKVVRNRSNLFGLPAQMNLIVGKLSMNSKGFGFIIPDLPKEAEKGDIFIPPTLLNCAMNNDKVIARLNEISESGRSREGEIVRILERANKQIVGTDRKSIV